MTYHPGLPDIEGMLRKLHPVLHSPQRFRDAIKEVPIVAFSQIYINIKKKQLSYGTVFLHNIYIYMSGFANTWLQKSLLYTL